MPTYSARVSHSPMEAVYLYNCQDKESMETHVAMSSGGAFAAVHAGFWQAVEQTGCGNKFRSSVSSLSGSSAGALVGMLVAEGVPAYRIAEDLHSGGLQGRFPLLRAMAVYFRLPGFKQAAFSGKPYILRMMKLSSARVHARKLMTVAVTDAQLLQQCVHWRQTGLTFVIA